MFADASTEVYGAAVYQRTTYASGEVKIELVLAKTKVTPLEAVNVPRLELLAAVLAARLSTIAASALKILSSEVLYWIQSRSRVYKVFIANRISIIQSLTNPSAWRYVSTDINPADLASRGCGVEVLSDSNLWWNGPLFLAQPDDQWPANRAEESNAGANEKRTQKDRTDSNIFSGLQTLFATSASESPIVWRLDPHRFSSWLQLKRVTAWVLRFVQNCQLPSAQRVTGELTLHELTESEERILKSVQEAEFSTELNALQKRKQVPKSSNLLPLTPTLDENGLVRCQGRLDQAYQLKGSG